MWRKGYSSKNSVRRWWWKHEEKLVGVSSPLLQFIRDFTIRIKPPSQLTTLSLKWFIFVIHRSGQRQDFESRAPWKNLGWMVKNFSSCRTCGKHSHNLQKLSHWISSTHNSTIPIVFFNQSLTNGLDWMANVSDLWLLFSVLKDCQSMWHFMKRVNSLMATIKLLSPALTLPQHFQS